MPYITQTPEQCSSCESEAIVKVVLMPNGYVIRCCVDHLVQLAEIKQAERKYENNERSS